MKMVKRFLVIAAAVLLMVGLFTADAKAEKKVGILLWTDEVRYSDGMSKFFWCMKRSNQ